MDECIKRNCYLSVALTLLSTVNSLYTDTRYNDKIRYNDDLNVTKQMLKK